MLHVLNHIRRLWMLILLLSTFCLISDIAVSCMTSTHARNYFVYPTPIIVDSLTVLVFVYCLWGKSRRFLLSTSSPKSNLRTRFIRGFGSVLLVLGWFYNTIIYSLTGNMTKDDLSYDQPGPEIRLRTFLVGVASLVIILTFVEMIGSIRLGREQRKVLKAQVDADNNATADSRQDSTSTKTRPMGSHEGSVKDKELDVTVIVRPDSVDMSQVVHSQQMMYEMQQYQQQIQQYQQYQQYLASQHLQQPQEGELSSNESFTVEQEGKYDDLLIQSSYKLEVPIDRPLQGAILHAPSAPAAPLAPRALAPSQPPSLLASSPLSTSSSSSFSSQKLGSTRKQHSSMSKDDISPMALQVLADMNPFTQLERVTAQNAASAPPYSARQPSLSIQSPVPPTPSLAPAPMCFISEPSTNTDHDRELDKIP